MADAVCFPDGAYDETGIHKHFQMLAISELMKNHGVADSNTTIPGIWSKLKTLYNLDGLDERVGGVYTSRRKS